MSVFFHIWALSGPKMHFIFFLISRLWNKARRWDQVSTGFRISGQKWNFFLHFSSYCVFKTRLRQHVTREWKRVFTAKAPKHVLDVSVFKCDWTNTLLHMLSLKQHLYLSIFTTKNHIFLLEFASDIEHKMFRLRSHVPSLCFVSEFLNTSHLPGWKCTKIEFPFRISLVSCLWSRTLIIRKRIDGKKVLTKRSQHFLLDAIVKEPKSFFFFLRILLASYLWNCTQTIRGGENWNSTYECNSLFGTTYFGF